MKMPLSRYAPGGGLLVDLFTVYFLALLGFLLINMIDIIEMAECNVLNLVQYFFA